MRYREHNYITDWSGWSLFVMAVWSLLVIQSLEKKGCHSDDFAVTGSSGVSHCNKLRSLQWRHNKRNGISNHRRHNCLPNHLSRRRKHQSFTSLAFVRGIHQWPVNSQHKGPVTQKMFPFNYVIMCGQWLEAVTTKQSLQPAFHLGNELQIEKVFPHIVLVWSIS